MRTNDEIQAALIAYLKSKSAVTNLVTATEIRECEWQGTDFTYPNIRVSTSLFPSINGCGPDKVESLIEVFSEQKSSREADSISSSMAKIFHKHPFSQAITLPNQSSVTVKFPIVVVVEVMKAERSIYGWLSKINLHTQVI